MDEFDKIREFSEGITNRKEPTFSQQKVGQTDPDIEQDDDASLYHFKPEYENRPGGMSPEDLEEKNFSSMKLHFIALGIFVGVLSIVLIGFFVFGSADETQKDVIMINATAEPVKVRPENPGGMAIPDQDKMVYDRMRTNNVNTKVENLFPEPEQPVIPNILAIENNAPDTKFVAMEDVQSINPLADEAAQAQSEPVKKVENVPLTAPAPAVKQKSAVKKTTSETEGGIWSVQLMSSSNKQTVEKAWSQILAKHKALLSNMTHKIMPAQIPGKGTFYRLRVGSFKTRDMANALCKKLKAQKQDCIPVK